MATPQALTQADLDYTSGLLIQGNISEATGSTIAFYIVAEVKHSC